MDKAFLCAVLAVTLACLGAPAYAQDSTGVPSRASQSPAPISVFLEAGTSYGLIYPWSESVGASVVFSRPVGDRWAVEAAIGGSYDALGGTGLRFSVTLVRKLGRIRFR